MLSLSFTTKVGLRSLIFSFSPLYWDFKPRSFGSWEPDFDDLTDYNINYCFLCFGICFKKRTDLTQFLIDKSK